MNLENQPYEDAIDRLIQHFTSPLFQADLQRARQEFFDEAGILDEHDQNIELRMTQFLDWYLFTRQIPSKHQTPAEFALELREFTIDPTEMPLYESLALTHHSLFEYLYMRGADLHFFDLFLDREMVVENCPVRIGFNRNEVFDARIVPLNGNFQFTKGFCFHPAEATPFIRGEVKNLGRLSSRAERDALMLRLMKMRYKFEHYRHLKLEHFYTNDKRVRL